MEIVLVFCLFGLIGSVYLLSTSSANSVMLIDQVKTRQMPKRKRKTRKVK